MELRYSEFWADDTSSERSRLTHTYEVLTGISNHKINTIVQIWEDDQLENTQKNLQPKEQNCLHSYLDTPLKRETLPASGSPSCLANLWKLSTDINISLSASLKSNIPKKYYYA